MASSSASASTSTADPADVAALSFEEARDALVRVVSDLEQGAPTLEESLALWERGEALAKRCEDWLMGAKARLDATRTGGPTGGPAGGVPNSGGE